MSQLSSTVHYRVSVDCGQPRAVAYGSVQHHTRMQAKEAIKDL